MADVKPLKLVDAGGGHGELREFAAGDAMQLQGALNEAPLTTLASAATINVGAEPANTINISGTATVTSLGTIASGAIRQLVFQSSLTLTHHATSLILPTGADIVTSSGDTAEFVSLGGGNWRCVHYARANGQALAATGGGFTGGTLTSALNEAPAVTIASAATVNIGAAAANTISVTGTTTITAFDTIADGAVRLLEFAGSLTLTHNATSLILPTGANIVTAAGDVAEFRSLGSGDWRCVGYLRADGTPLAGITPSAIGFFAKPSGVQSIPAATFTKVYFQTESYDTNSWYDSSTGRFTPLVAGKYLVFCCVGLSHAVSTNTGKRLITAIYKNGVIVASNSASMNNTATSSAPLAMPLIMNGSTDYIEIFFRHDLSAAGDTSVDPTFFAVQYGGA